MGIPQSVSRTTIFTLLGICLLLWQCSKDSSAPGDDGDLPDYRPLVMLHGFLGSGDTYASFTMRFRSNGYPADHLHAFDWNSINGNRDTTIAALDELIESVRTATGAARVDLAGHSAGGGLAYDYLADSARAAKVAHYAHLASFPASAPPGPDSAVNTLNIWSTADEVIAGADIPGARNVRQTAADHYQVATAPESFAELFAFLNADTPPRTTAIEPEGDIRISGKILSLGENETSPGDRVDIYALEPATGRRAAGTPSASFVAGTGGNWGPFSAQPDTPYEFCVQPADSTQRMIHYYREPFPRSNSLVYLRTIPPPTSLIGGILGTLPADDNQTVLAVFASSQAVISGRDSLTVDDLELSTPGLAAAGETVIALFLYDDGDGQTGGNATGPFVSFPFLTGVDVFLPADNGISEIRFNGRSVKIVRRPSQSQGVTVAVFD